MSALPRFVVFGEALTDFIRQDDERWLAQPGGACWNVARVASRLGIATGYGGALSTDVFGDELARLSAEAGLDARFIQRTDAAPLLAMVPSTRPPQYFFVGESDLAFDPAQLPEGWLAAAEIVQFGCISLARQPLAGRLVETAKAAAAAGKRIAFDPNWREPMNAPHYADTFRTVAALANYIKVSDEDLGQLFAGQTPEQGLASLRALAPQADILLTRGSEGMRWLHGDAVIDQPVFKVDVVDTVGCGDASMGGWMASVLHAPAAPVATHLRHAAAAAALAASHAGAYAASWEEVDAMAGRP
ncbi:carbohydrate kinase family protein [Jeongeupia naejangsanensis]|uniref:Carbohydrate kinase n=1 Tax=Jeongeupia naejangsanensis TaxID=613195 RepID=A0ABS2BPX5_9NEIS|nr:carbohydrate kinase [Jeongeupia naejangsanensis]MBM3117672.1 carbohydrate kinase [Jeongeupia naejangsanensis]